MRLQRVVVSAIALALVVVAAGLTSAPRASATGSTFSDVPAAAPFAADIEWLASEGIAQGGADGKFRPNAPVTRQAMAVFIYHFANRAVDAPRCSSSPFPDLPASSLYCGSITWLTDEGITRGTEDGKFRPLAPITRQAMAAFLYHLEYGGSAPASCVYDAYADVHASSAYCGSIAWLYAEGVTTSSPSGNFAPVTSVTRGMMAAFLHRYDAAKHAVVGADVSYPQCGRSLPTGQAFGIVGVNGGKPTTFNSCLATELAWAAGSVGGTSQPRIQLYVNTANPGGLGTASWPTSGTNGYGPCAGENSTACAYEYGRTRATADAAAVTSPEDYMWWLDVETENSWDGTVGGTARNAAVLEGMTNYFHSLGVAGVGLYSTAYQWGQIVGSSVSARSPLQGLPSWLAGATAIGSAKRHCSLPPLTAGGTVVLTQYVDRFDRNHAC